MQHGRKSKIRYPCAHSNITAAHLRRIASTRYRNPFLSKAPNMHRRTPASCSELRSRVDARKKRGNSKLRANNGPNSTSQTFVGTDGIMMKSTTMDAVKLYDTLDGEGTILDSSSYIGIVQLDLRRIRIWACARDRSLDVRFRFQDQI